ncbi:transmembrane protein 87A-like [Macrobrachium nipponense]|uniref:transmembrane protein 87A-like n=1 Tax=Macrobrachium nipponense TaxID=159736 RepID=UPI0030C81707
MTKMFRDNNRIFVFLFSATYFALVATSSPEQGVWHLVTDKDHEFHSVKKSMFNGSRMIMKVKCDPGDPGNTYTDGQDVSSPASKEDLKIKISWMLLKTPCWNDYIFEEVTVLMTHAVMAPHNTQLLVTNVNEEEWKTLNSYLRKLDMDKARKASSRSVSRSHSNEPITVAPNPKLIITSSCTTKTANPATEIAGLKAALKRMELQMQALQDDRVISKQDITSGGTAQTNHPIAIIIHDGVYILVVHTEAAFEDTGRSYTAYIDIQMKSDYGYLSAVDWPLLGFYAAMCVVYLIYGLAWLIVSFMRWRELLRVQYWIGAVILLGMLEKAVFTAEYSSINQRGYSVPGLIIFAELVSCAKRTLARMLVIIVSLGFGIVKPRLGMILHRVVGVGLLYFILASVEGCTRILQSRTDPHKKVLLGLLPLALLESAICFWIFAALVQTTRTLRLRRNLVKLSLYRHFTNTLAFAVLASVIFMLWSLRYHLFEQCITDWKELWVDDAYWHVLFAIILLVIMILWRPSNNNQRFAFSPLLDDGSDADDEEEGEKLMADVSDTMKYRNTRNSTSSSPRDSRSVEDDLKWVEENIPSSLADSALPILDSDEEIVTTKFEISKMQ